MMPYERTPDDRMTSITTLVLDTGRRIHRHGIVGAMIGPDVVIFRFDTYSTVVYEVVIDTMGNPGCSWLTAIIERCPERA